MIWYLSQSVQVAVTKMPLGDFNNKHLFLTVLEAGKSTVKVLEDSVYDEGLLLGSQMAVTLLCPHME